VLVQTQIVVLLRLIFTIFLCPDLSFLCNVSSPPPHVSRRNYIARVRWSIDVCFIINTHASDIVFHCKSTSSVSVFPFSLNFFLFPVSISGSFRRNVSHFVPKRARGGAVSSPFGFLITRRPFSRDWKIDAGYDFAIAKNGPSRNPRRGQKGRWRKGRREVGAVSVLRAVKETVASR